MKLRLIPVFILYLALSGFNFVFAQTDQIAGKPLEIHFFYSLTCPHCIAEQKFLDKIEQKYPDVAVKQYLVSDPQNQILLKELANKYGAERYLGLVPLTFIGEDFFVGFDNDKGIGKKIENSIKKQINNIPAGQSPAQGQNINLPFIEEIDAAAYSLPAIAVLAGFLDGFNVRSLGALVLILGLVLALRSRKKILFFGGIYILTTAVVYSILITLWYKLFTFLSPYLKITEFFIGVLAIGGGIYFLKEYLKFRKYGPACEIVSGNIVKKSIKKLQDSLRGAGNIFFLGGSVLLFAAVIAIVEFPCSAAIPVIFAGILAKAQLSSFAYLFYMAIFLLFYMFDEFVVFLIAVWKMNIWISSPKFTTWAVLIESILLFLFGFYYLVGIF
jgi:thiol-disulfide isomerase/thioredoxin